MQKHELKALLQTIEGAEERGDVLFLRDPHWSAAEQAAVAALQSQPDQAPPGSVGGWLAIRTGGSGGGLKFARHDQNTLSAAVRGFTAHFGLTRVNAVGVLPRHHVSGLMAWLRTAMTGGTYVPWNWKRLAAGDFPVLPGDDFVVSVVPTQLHRLLAAPGGVEWLRRCGTVLVGGAPLWPGLAEQAAHHGVRLAPSYGLTETAAMVTAVRPAEFLRGDRSSGTALPHAQVDLSSDGVVRVGGESLFRGYWPEWRAEREFLTEDLGRIDDGARLHLLGRRDAAIITGGRKVHPAEVEGALRASGQFDDVAVIGVPDPDWGEIVVACYPPQMRPPDATLALHALAGPQRPKRFVAVPEWPRNGQGKIDRPRLVAMVASSITGPSRPPA